MKFHFKNLHYCRYFFHKNQTITSLQENKITYFKAHEMIFGLKRKINIEKSTFLMGIMNALEIYANTFFQNGLFCRRMLKFAFSASIYSYCILAELAGEYFFSDIDTFLSIQKPFRDFFKMQSLSLKKKSY